MDALKNILAAAAGKVAKMWENRLDLERLSRITEVSNRRGITFFLNPGESRDLVHEVVAAIGRVIDRELSVPDDISFEAHLVDVPLTLTPRDIQKLTSTLNSGAVAVIRSDRQIRAGFDAPVVEYA